MWGHIVQMVEHWPWSTIAAFAAAAAALWIARSETRERSQALGRQVIVEVQHSALQWSIECSRFIGLIQKHIQNQASAAYLNEEGLEDFTATTGENNRVFKTARLACNDFELQVRLAEAESHVGALLDALDRPARGNESERDRLDRMVSVGLASLKGFNLATEALANRGFALYSPRRGVRYRIAQWRWDRAVKAEVARTAETPDPATNS